MVYILSFIIAFLLSYLLVPLIIKIAIKNELYDVPNARSSHSTIVPLFGGVAVVVASCISLLIFGSPFLVASHFWILLAFMLIFGVGLVDDYVGVSPRNKILFQLIVAFILIAIDYRITNLFGLFGIYILHTWVSYILSSLVIIFFINAYNLIDGINGLLGGLSVVAALFFAYWFSLINDPLFAIGALSLAGASIGFLKYNITPAKIYMGDSGSMVIGFLMALLTLRFLEVYTTSSPNVLSTQRIISIALSFSFLPIFDAFRVFIIRIYNKKNPFHSDRLHFHHLLLDNGYSHSQATSLLVIGNILLISFALCCDWFSSLGNLLIMTIATSLITAMLTRFKLKNRQNEK